MPRTNSWLVLLPPAALILLGFVFFSSTGRDDAHITFWPAHTLAVRGEIVNYNGERVEQSSSLLLVIVLAILTKVTGVALPTLGSVLSILAAAAAAVLGQRAAAARSGGPGIVAGLLVATSSTFVYWAFSGLETTLVALLGLWLVVCLARELDSATARRPRAGTALAMTCFALSRPEAGIVLLVTLACCFFLCIHAGSREAKRSVGLLAALAGLLVIGIAAGRWAYFGSVFPQPVWVKSAGLNPLAMAGGAGYLLRHGLASTLFPVLLLAAAGTIAAWALRNGGRPRDPLGLAAAAFLTAGTAFIVASGGDWMEGGRFLAPLWPVAAVVAAAVLAQRFAPRTRAWIAGGIVAVQLLGVAAFARSDSTGVPVWAPDSHADPQVEREFSWFERANRIHRRDIPVVLKLRSEVERIAKTRPGPVRIMTGQMGLVPFHLALGEAGAIRTIDTRGLTDRVFSSCEVTAGRPRSSIGLVLSYGFYFAHQEEIRDRCGVDAPDVIYDLGEYYDEVVNRGYVPVYRDVGAVSSGSPLFPGDPLDRGEFIAVRRDLAGPSTAFVGATTPGYDGDRARGNGFSEGM